MKFWCVLPEDGDYAETCNRPTVLLPVWRGAK